MPPDTNTAPNPDQFAQLVQSVETANNVLVTVSANPSIDQLAACIGLTLALNKKGKHATAVFSGKVPSTLEFLQPEKTIEKNTDSLQDFIISLDKSKADKLRYKIEDDFVKIFITPYRSSVSEVDLNFSQGDFNIDLIITIGVNDKADLDAAIIAHGRILHDATVSTITTSVASQLGSINWQDNEASSLCEMVTDFVNAIAKELVDSQIATALLTGMVAETDRFGNEKARPHTMSLSGVLMAAGASPQLITSKLEEPEPEPEPEEEPTPEPEAPVIEEGPEEELPEVVEEPPVAEPEPVVEPEPPVEEEPEPEPEPEAPSTGGGGEFKIDHDDDIHIDEQGQLRAVKELEAAQAELEKQQEDEAKKAADELEKLQAEAVAAAAAEVAAAPETEQPPVDGRGLILEPPQLGGQLTANSVSESQQYAQATNTFDGPASPILGRQQENVIDTESPAVPQTLSDLERSINSPHAEDSQEPIVTEPPVPDVPQLDDARAIVDQAVADSDTYRPEPISALNATPMDLSWGSSQATQPEPDQSQDSNTTPPPPVPPPMPPSTFNV